MDEVKPVKLNLGCGEKLLPGYVNVDLQRPKSTLPAEAVFLESDIRKLPYEEGTVDEILASHIIEHFYIWEVPDMLSEWFRILKPGGKLTVDAPDIFKCAINLLQLRTTGQPVTAINLGLWGFYGNPLPKDALGMHKWGWVPESVIQALVLTGFTEVVEAPPEKHGFKGPQRDMRIVATKPEKADG